VSRNSRGSSASTAARSQARSRRWNERGSRSRSWKVSRSPVLKRSASLPPHSTTSWRKEAATDLRRRMEAELKTLGMRAPVFEPRLGTLSAEEASFTHRDAALGAEGADT